MMIIIIDLFQNLQIFLKYPNDPNIAYAHYLLGMAYYNKIVDEKDLEPLKKSKNNSSM